MSLETKMSGMQFVVNPTGVITDLVAKRFVVEGVVRNNPEKREMLKSQGIIGTELDRQIVSTTRSAKGTFIKYPSLISGGDIFNIFSTLSFKPDEELRKSVAARVTSEYDYPEEAVEEIMGLLPECQKILGTDAGRDVITQTTQYRNKIANLWERCGDILDDYILQVVGEQNLENNGKKMVVSVRAPLYRNQKNYGEEKGKTIFFYSQALPQTPEEEKRQDAYTLGALCHANVQETLLPYKMSMTQPQKEKFNAFIKFLTDKEIYHMLTNESYLGIDTAAEKGDVMAKVYPYWLGYLHRKDSNPTLEIQKDLNRDKEAFEALTDPKKKKLYGSYGFDKLSAKKIAYFFMDKKGITPYEFVKIDFDNRDAVELDEKSYRTDR